jgi:alkanesulfonate monooxygenase SsuD/methylene tetrahydromethanopterin reductase-like flavin-dependent oxidoreductase (luciferase family)
VETSVSELAPSLKPALRRARVCESIERMELGVHLPLMEFGDEGQSLGRLQATVDAGRSGFVAVSANDHFVFSTPWLDGLTALAAVIDRTGEMTLATTISLAALRGPVPLAKALAALDVLSDGRLVAGVGPGSSERDYDAVGIPFDDRWKRFDEAVRILRALLRQERAPQATRYFTAPDLGLAPRQSGGVPLWIGSWGSAAGLRRVARLGDGWLASAYNTTPEQFVCASALLGDELRRRCRRAEQFPNALVTMWTWITESRVERERVLADVLAPLLKRDVDELRDRVCVGSAGKCAELLSRCASAGCQRVYLWPLGDEPRQIELAAAEVAPCIDS